VIGAASPARRLAWAARAERLRAEAHAERAPENDDDGVVRFQITAYYTFGGCAEDYVEDGDNGDAPTG